MDEIKNPQISKSASMKYIFMTLEKGIIKKVDNLYYKPWTPAKTSTKPKSLQEMSHKTPFKDL